MPEAVGDKADGKQLLVWFQDEARVGQQGTTTRPWAPKGTRPRALKQLGFESASVFGSVCPGKSMGEGIVMPKVNTEAVNEHVALLSSRLQPDEHAVLVCDRASWHRCQKLASSLQHHAVASASLFPRTQPGGASLAMAKTTLLGKPCLHGLRRHCGHLLCGLEHLRPPTQTGYLPVYQKMGDNLKLYFP
ncbi:MAG: transposase [Myxococcota bacterium]